MRKLIPFLFILLGFGTLQAQKKFATDSLRVEDYLVVTKSNGDTMLVISGTNVKLHGHSSGAALLHIQTRRDLSNEEWNIGAINTDGTFIIGNVSKTLTSIVIDTLIGSVEFQEGYHREYSFDAIAFFPPDSSTNLEGATLDTLRNSTDDDEEVYAFPSNEDRHLKLKFYLPTNFQQVDSIKLFLSVNSTAGDSAQFGVKKKSIAVGEDPTGTAYANSQTKIIEFNATAGVRNELTFTSVTGTFAAEDYFYLLLERNIGISNDEVADVRFHGCVIFLQ